MIALRQPPWGKSLFTSQIARIMFLICALIILQSSPVQAQWTANGNNINNTNTGNVGIGTTSPDLTGVGSVYGRVVSIANATNRSVLELANLQDGLTDGSALGQLNFISGSATKYRTAAIVASQNGSSAGIGNLDFYTAPTAGNLTFAMRIDKSGNVGIGTSNPNSKLEVSFSDANTSHNNVTFPTISNTSNAGAFTGMTFRGVTNSGVSYPAGTLAYDYSPGASILSSNFHLRVVNAGNFNEALTVLNSGNVGIGTSNPNSKLEVSFSDANTSHNNVTLPTISNTSNTAGAFTGMIFRGVTNSGVSYPAGTLAYDYSPGASILSSNFHLRVVNAGNFNEALTVLNSGNVGIGTTTPTTKLHVAGSITVDGNINAKYQDLAEWVPAAEQIPAGTVVVLDSTKSNQVIASSQSYDTRVAGVISKQPGIALGEGGNGKVLVATTGRVRVKVDASRAPIHIGDLLVTSDVPGVAMKSEPIKLGGRLMHMPGTLIGKALEPLAKGESEILVLLSLQ